MLGRGKKCERERTKRKCKEFDLCQQTRLWLFWDQILRRTKKKCLFCNNLSDRVDAKKEKNLKNEKYMFELAQMKLVHSSGFVWFRVLFLFVLCSFNLVWLDRFIRWWTGQPTGYVPILGISSCSSNVDQVSAQYLSSLSLFKFPDFIVRSDSCRRKIRFE